MENDFRTCSHREHTLDIHVFVQDLISNASTETKKLLSNENVPFEPAEFQASIDELQNRLHDFQV